MKPSDFLNLKYKPKSSDLVCLFRVEPNKVSIKEASENIALESSIGTWDEVGTEKEYMKKLGAKVFSIKGKSASAKSYLSNSSTLIHLISSCAFN